ncbi:MAG: hypothetical protein WKF34_00185 [Pyrinomonadaceae bacterium]
MPLSVCPECSEEVFVDAEIVQGDDVSCDECHSRLTVVGLDPVELDLKDETEADERADRDEFGSYDLDDDRY